MTTSIKGKVAIVGAGNVGATTAFALMNSGTVSEIALIDIDREKAEGEAMDLSHGGAFVEPVDVYVGDYEDCWDADVVVITAGASQKPGESRMELLERNVAIFEDMVPQITERIDPETVLLVVTNPVDILSYVTWDVSNLPHERIIGSGTVLDTARFKQVLSQQCDVAAQNVHAYVIGEHGDSEVLVWSSANLGGIPFESYAESHGVDDIDALKASVEAEVREAAYEIIERKERTNYGVARSVAATTERILGDDNSILTVSTLVSGEHGIDDVYMSLPCTVNQGGVRDVHEFDLSADETAALRESAGVIRESLDRLDLQ